MRKPSSPLPPVSRRRFLGGGAAIGGALFAPALFAPSIVTAETMRPQITHGIQSGDIGPDSAIVWARADRPARMIVEVATTDSFKDPRRIVGPAALENSDYTAKLDLAGLPAGQDIIYRVRFQDLGDLTTMSAPMTGHFRTAPAAKRTINFVWSGDTAGQGWGINPDWGGMKIYEVMRGVSPDFFIHSGDTIYADGPIKAEVALEDGTVWRNLTTEEKAKVAETLAEFRGAFKYNLMDENVRRMNAEVPLLAQWDDHETLNNWYPTEILDRDEYTVKSVALLSARANQAFREFMPLRPNPQEAGRIYRAVPYGPSLDVFFLDMRTYRGPNTGNRQPQPGADTAFLGADQMRWLKQALLGSRATWKVIAADMPIGIIVRDGDKAFENVSNGDGPALGRELEIADLLRFIKYNDIKNVVWLTADVHYTAAHRYDPDKARFTDFNPFWEFVTGPLNAGTFGPNEMDDTFGPQVVFIRAPEGGRANLPPTEGLQFFGHVTIDGEDEVMTVRLNDLTGETLHKEVLTPERVAAIGNTSGSGRPVAGGDESAPGSKP
jgi:alkaline phosphatase D